MNILDRYLNYRVIVTIPHLGCIHTHEYLNQIARNTGAMVEDKAKRYPTTRQIVFIFPNGVQAKAFTDTIDQRFQQSFCRYWSAPERRFNTYFALFTHLVKTMDWEFAMSDDHRVWSAGQQQLDTIKFLIKELMPTNAGTVSLILHQAGKESLLTPPTDGMGTPA